MIGKVILKKKFVLYIYVIKIIFIIKNGWGCNRLVVCEYMDVIDFVYLFNLYKIFFL